MIFTKIEKDFHTFLLILYISLCNYFTNYPIVHSILTNFYPLYGVFSLICS